MRTNTNDLAAFIVVARERSFTRAAATLGVSPSAVSHSMRGLEARLGVRLLARTTRSVSPTEAGERLLQSIGPKFDEIEADLAALSELRDKPAGSIRISADQHSTALILWPALRRILPDYPDIHVEVVTDNSLIDIVAERYDAGIRLGGIVAKDMIAVAIGPAMRMAAVAAPAYFAKHGRPATPQDLTGHNCINIRLPTNGGVYAWEFDQDGREFRVRVEGQLIFNSVDQIHQAVLDGFGIAYMGEDLVAADVAAGRLEMVLSDWCSYFSGYHLYYPSRRQHTPAFAVLLEALRYRPNS